MANAERDLKIIELYQLGNNLTEVGELVGLSTSMIGKILAANGVEARSRKRDLMGRRFGRLIVIGCESAVRGKTKWLCQCDCGNTPIVSASHLIRGTCTSCGCFQIENIKRISTTHGFAAGGKLTLEYSMYLSAKRRAKKQGVPFEIEIHDIVIPEFCPVFPSVRLLCNTGAARDNSPTLDKLIPELGYVKNNIQVISFKANRVKNSANLDELKAVTNWLERELNSRGLNDGND